MFTIYLGLQDKSKIVNGIPPAPAIAAKASKVVKVRNLFLIKYVCDIQKYFENYEHDWGYEKFFQQIGYSEKNPK
jgi:hypothetical protein